MRFNPPPSWPSPPQQDWQPPAGWQPDPAWGPPPPGWQLWVEDDPAPAPTSWAGRHPRLTDALLTIPVLILGVVVVGVLLIALGAGAEGAGEIAGRLLPVLMLLLAVVRVVAFRTSSRLRRSPYRGRTTTAILFVLGGLLLLGTLAAVAQEV